MDPRAHAVLSYWISEDYATMPGDFFSPDWGQRWFGGGEAQDNDIKEKFGAAVEDMRGGKLSHWRTQSANECLAGIILMDQFTRNMYRGTKDMYCMDDQGREWAAHLKGQPEFENMHPMFCFFVLLPFMHGETVADQEMALSIISEQADKVTGKYGEESPLGKMLNWSRGSAIEHKAIVDKWGRFPHRNAIMERESTPEEAAGLADGSIKGF